MGYWYNEDAGRYTILGYGLFVLAGGLAAWYRARSRISLVSSAVSALFLLLAFILSFWFPIIAFAIGAIVSLNLAINFAVRLQTTRKFMPAGMLMLISLAVFSFLVYLASRAPVKGFHDDGSGGGPKARVQQEPRGNNVLSLRSVGLARDNSNKQKQAGAGAGAGEGARKDVLLMPDHHPPTPEPQSVRLRGRQRVRRRLE